MSLGASIFWMGGKLAQTCVEISHDPEVLNQDGFWAVQIDYEGRWTCARFADVQSLPFPKSEPWTVSDGKWESTLSKTEYMDYVERIREAIAWGELYQANACLIYSKENGASLAGLFEELLAHNPAPYSAYLKLPGIEIASASPELFLSIDKGRLCSSPIKGTSKDGSFPDKDRAENIMIVDLIRNDLGSVCITGSVQTPRLLATEEHPGLYHLVSDVTGQLKEGATWQEISDALLPAGSISGAPKSSATALIAKNEGARGPYCGIIGWVESGKASLAVGIRTFWQEKNLLKFGTGAGITWGSDALTEWDETQLKAHRLMAIADGRHRD